MKISQQKLDQIIKEELDAAIEEGFLDNIKSMGSRAGSKVAGAFGADTASREMGAKADSLRDKSASEKAKKRGKRRREKADSAARSSGQTYPATELTALAATLRNVASKSGVPFPGSRGNMVSAFEKVLRSGGYALDEARGERVFIGQEGNIEISADAAPQLVKWLAQVKEASPELFARVAEELSNYRFDVPAELAAAEAAGEEPGETPGEEEDIDVDAIAGSEEELDTSAAAIEKGATFAYTSRSGKESAVQVLDPENDHGATVAQKIDPASCAPVKNSQFASKPEKFAAAVGEPIEKCSTDQEGSSGGEEQNKQIKAGLLDIVDAVAEKWEKLSAATGDPNLKKSMDYIEKIALSEAQRHDLKLKLLESLEVQRWKVMSGIK